MGGNDYHSARTKSASCLSSQQPSDRGTIMAGRGSGPYYYMRGPTIICGGLTTFLWVSSQYKEGEV